jgi:hypothetical protein
MMKWYINAPGVEPSIDFETAADAEAWAAKNLVGHDYAVIGEDDAPPIQLPAYIVDDPLRFLLLHEIFEPMVRDERWSKRFRTHGQALKAADEGWDSADHDVIRQVILDISTLEQWDRRSDGTWIPPEDSSRAP